MRNQWKFGFISWVPIAYETHWLVPLLFPSPHKKHMPSVDIEHGLCFKANVWDGVINSYTRIQFSIILKYVALSNNVLYVWMAVFPTWTENANARIHLNVSELSILNGSVLLWHVSHTMQYNSVVEKHRKRDDRVEFSRKCRLWCHINYIRPSKIHSWSPWNDELSKKWTMS